MPSLASMRSVDPAGDSMQPLGPPIRQQQGVAIPLPKPTGTPGVVQLPDGKLATNLPPPPQLAPYEWELDAAVAGGTVTARFSGGKLHITEIAKQYRTPLVGDWVRVRSGQFGIPEIEAMIGGVYQVMAVQDTTVEVDRWSFYWPGAVSNDGQLMTEFAEAPQ